MFKKIIMTAGLFSTLLSACGTHGPSDADQSRLASRADSERSVSDRQLTLILGPFSRSVTVSEIADFAGDSRADNNVSALLKAGKINAEELRAQLNKVFEFDVTQMDKLLNSSIGIALLKKLGEAVHPHSFPSSAVQALRSALILSLADDNKFSPVEVISHIPVDIDIELIELMKLRKELGNTFGTGSR
ncbi:MAG: hypothetical protein RIR26_573 [Pseudomonadota bacterium]|jgi:hypothetical protein